MTEDERKKLEEDRSRLLGGSRPPNTALDLAGNTVVREPSVSPTNWQEVDKAREEGKMLRVRMSVSGGGPIPGPASAPKKDGMYVPLPAGLDKEWIDYIKSGRVPPLLGAAGHVYPPPRFGFFGAIGVFRQGKWRYDQLMSGVYECWFDQTSQEEISKAVRYMRKVNKVYLNFLRERIPGFENAYIVMESPTVGTREGRRIFGEYVLAEEDLLEGRRFPDVIAMGGTRGPDAHSVTGLWGDGIVSELKNPYDIPYRCLVPQKIDNLLVAGRCMSTTFLALGGTRSQGVCMSTGDAAGAAAALSITQGTTPRKLDVKLLQQALRNQGALLSLDV